MQESIASYSFRTITFHNLVLSSFRDEEEWLVLLQQSIRSLLTLSIYHWAFV